MSYIEVHASANDLGSLLRGMTELELASLKIRLAQERFLSEVTGRAYNKRLLEYLEKELAKRC
jgi:hypothetical protein